MNELIISEKTTAFQPRKAPMAAMNFTSPSPIASRGQDDFGAHRFQVRHFLGIQIVLADLAVCRGFSRTCTSW